MNKIVSLYSKYSFSILILVLTFTNCKSDKNRDHVNNSIIDFENFISNEANLYDFADSLEFTFLEYDTGNLVGKILNFKATKNYLFVVDQQQKLFVFKKNGDLFSFIHNKGEGPSEYISIEDFIVDSNEKHVVILDPRGGKLLKYDIFGNFIDRYSIGYTHATHISKLMNGNYAIFQSARFSNENHNIFLLDQNFQKVDSIVEPIGTFIKNLPYLFDTHWYDYDNNACYKEFLVDTVFRVNENNRSEPHLLFNLGKKRMPNEYYTETNYYRQHAHKYYQIGNISESKNYVFISVTYNNKSKYFLFDKEKSQLEDLGLNALPIHTFNLDIEFWPAYVYEETLYQIIDPTELYQKLKSSPKAYKLKQILELNDNPVFLSCNLLPIRK
ncbi:MAG: 6-bladed beta-propeller [Cyclobacteriaceae bacterium]